MATERSLLFNLKERREGNAMLTAANDLERLSHGADTAGERFVAMAHDAKTLNAEIEATKIRIQDLATQFARTKDKSLFGDLRSERRYLSDLTKISEELAGVAGKTATSALGEALTDHKLAAGVTAAGAALAVPLGAMIAGAVTGAAGAGGIIGGLVAAAQNPAGVKALSKFKTDIANEFAASGTVMVGPLQDALSTLSRDFRQMHLGDVFAAAAPYVHDFADAVGHFAINIMPGFTRTLENAAPVMAALDEELPKLGTEIGDFFATVSSSPGAADGIHVLFTVLDDGLWATGVLLKGLSDQLHNFPVTSLILQLGELQTAAQGDVVTFRDFKGPAADLATIFGSVDTAGHKVRREIETFGTAVSQAEIDMRQAADAALQLSESFKLLFNVTLSQDEANIAFKKGMLDLQQTFKENGKVWDENTKKGLDNRDALDQQIRKAEQLRQANIDSGMSAADANKIYDQQIQKLYDTAKAAGATKDVLAKLAGVYRIDVLVNLFESIAKSTVDFATGAINSVLHPGKKGDKGSGGFKGFASGGTTPAFEPFRVHDGEMFWSSREHYVSTAAQSRTLDVSSPQQSAPQQPVLLGSDGSRLGDLLIDIIRLAVQARGGNPSVLGIRG